ncbi:hypothetical protein AN958_02766 [Leucoagaricus sp. SymC.cos]|nr:hypothetical protein AN958_02766 [Leucoagaricus sp. SymC.cos]
MSQHIKPSLVENYLTRIIHYMTPLYPEVRCWWSTALVTQALCRCKKLYPKLISRCHPLLPSKIDLLTSDYIHRPAHDDLLFLTQVLFGFVCLLWLGKLVFSDDQSLDAPQKFPLQKSVSLITEAASFFLPYHKADRFFEGNKIMALSNNTLSDPVSALTHYFNSHDNFFPEQHALWLCANGRPPCYAWFLHWLCAICGNSIGGHSMCSRGATALTNKGVPLDLI